MCMPGYSNLMGLFFLFRGKFLMMICLLHTHVWIRKGKETCLAANLYYYSK